MMCSIFESAAYNFRETDDLLNPVGAAKRRGAAANICDFALHEYLAASM